MRGTFVKKELDGNEFEIVTREGTYYWGPETTKIPECEDTPTIPDLKTHADDHEP